MTTRAEPASTAIIDRYQKRKSASLALSERMLRSYLRPYLWLLGGAVLANIIVAGAAGVLPLLIQKSVDSIFVAGDSQMLLLIPLGIIAVSALRALATYSSNLIMGFVGQRTAANIQSDLYLRLIHGDLADINATHSGEYISLFMNDVTRLAQTINQSIISLMRDLLTVVALTIYMFTMNPAMATIYAGIIIPFSLILIRRLGRITRKAAQRGLEGTGDLSSIISETLSGLRIVKAYGQEDTQTRRTHETIESVLRQAMRVVRARAAAGPVVEVLAGLGIAATVYYGGRLSLNGELTAGAFMGFISALLMNYQPLRSAANLQTILQEGVAAGRRVFTVLDAPACIVNPAGAPTLKAKRGELRFENVGFQYVTRATKTLHNINFTVAPGQNIALVGASGSGKSTLINLVLRFFDVSQGRILIDGQDIRDVTVESLRAATALVTQDPFLFDDTIAANIAYGRKGARRKDIEQAARTAAAHDFIMAQPDGYNTRVGESGLRLSGGQKQRVSIARAVLKDAPILLLDEATSSLDTESEAQVQSALSTLMQGRTSLAIAHRLSTIIHADCIFVMQDGHIAEHGTHAELLQLGGLYARLYQTQLDGNGG